MEYGIDPNRFLVLNVLREIKTVLQISDLYMKILKGSLEIVIIVMDF
jgi:hypothetical protein